jgi:hypothetical protein
VERRLPPAMAPLSTGTALMPIRDHVSHALLCEAICLNISRLDDIMRAVAFARLASVGVFDVSTSTNCASIILLTLLGQRCVHNCCRA